MTGAIPFEVPAKFAAQLQAGDLMRAGTLLKDSGSGQIVAHLQETGLAQKLISSAVNSPFSPLEALSAPSSVIANVQLAQLKTMMEGLQILQFANLGATVAGIGVSAVGFALMNKKLNGLQDQIAGFSSHVAASFRAIHDRELRAHYSHLHGLFNRADQAHTLSNPAREWLDVSTALADESAYFRGEIPELLKAETFDSDLFTSLTRSYALCNSARIECLVLARELRTADKVSRDIAGDYNALFDPLQPIDLAHRSSAVIENKEIPQDHLLRQELANMKNLVTNIRDTQDAAMSRPYLMETLIERKIDGYDYMQALSNENERPILLLEAK